MKPSWLLVLGLVASPAFAVETDGTEIDPAATAKLRDMSNYLSSLKTFRVDARTVDEKVTTDGQKIQEIQQSKVTVRRPGELRVDRVSPRGHVTFVDDGRQFSIYNRDKNIFANAPAAPNLDAAIDQARERLHIDAPGGDFIVNNPYGELTDGLITGRYVGLEPIGGVMAHHVAVTKHDVDYQIWIQDGPQPVPLRYVITTKDLPGQPDFTMDLRNWQPNVPLAPNTFAFAPPAGARCVEMSQPQPQLQPQREVQP